MGTRVRMSFVALALLSLACSDDNNNRLPLQPVGVQPNELSAYISVSNPIARVGDEVTVVPRALRGSAIGPIGSFTIRLGYDSTALKFVQAANGTGGMVMTNARALGTLVAAGASSNGFPDEQLFAATFKVMHPNALTSLKLTVTEMNGSDFSDHRAQTRVERQLYRAR